MPSVGMTRPIVDTSHAFGFGEDESRCDCCPYGYHIDRDFVPFTKKMLSREGDVKRLQELKDKWRCERQSMDELLGGTSNTFNTWDVSPVPKPISHTTTKTTFWDRVKATDEGFRSTTPRAFALTTSRTSISPAPSTDQEFTFRNGLDEAVTDFEEALLRTQQQTRALSYEIPDSKKFHTFPRIKAPILKEGSAASGPEPASTSLFSTYHFNKGSSITSSSSASTVVMKECSSKRPSLRDLSKQLEQNFLRGSATAESDSSELMTARLSELEEKIKLIPDLELKLSQVREEKQQLSKQLEHEKSKVESLESNLNNNRSWSSQSLSPNIEKCDKKVTPPVPPRRRTRDASVGCSVSTRDVGVLHTLPRTRSIAVGGSVSGEVSSWERSSRASSPTGSWSGSLRRRVKSFEVGVQVNDHEFIEEGKQSAPLLQIVEGIDVGVQTLSLDEHNDRAVRSQRETKVIKKSIALTAKPKTCDAGHLIKPIMRDSSNNTVLEVEEKKIVKHIGISAILDGPESKPRLKSVALNTDKPRVQNNGTNTVPWKEETVKSPVSAHVCSRCKQGEVAQASKSTTPAAVDSPVSSSSGSPTSCRLLSIRGYLDEESRKETSEKFSFPKVSRPAPIAEEVETKKSPDFQPNPNLSLPLTEGGSKLCTETFPTGSLSSDANKVVRSDSKIPRLASPLLSPKFKSSASFGHVESQKQPSSPTPAPASPSGRVGPPVPKKPTFQRSDTYSVLDDAGATGATGTGTTRDKPRSASSSLFGFATIQEKREKATLTKEMHGALKVLNDALIRGKMTQPATKAISIILHEWFLIAGTKRANPLDVEDYLDEFESYSPQLLRYIVNMPDGNGNTAMHYAVSHGNFDVVSILLDSKVCDPNKANRAGYTSVMLVSLAKIASDTHRQVVRRLFSLGDVNIKAAQHGQTALMLGASHGRLDTVKLLLEAGADINIQDEDGSTALMCAAEHGHGDIVSYLLAQQDCDPHITDNDGSTALTVAMEAGHKDIGVMVYAHMHFVRPAPSPPGSLSGLKVKRSHSTTPVSTSSSKSASPATSPVAAKKNPHSLD